MGDWKRALNYALRLAANGLSVFPCNNDKSPACRGGFYSATREAGAIRAHWRRSRAPLVGVPTGVINSVAVLDIDVQHDGDAWLHENFDGLPRTRVHATRSGGFHLLFLHRDGLGCATSWIAPGVDLRGDGGYAIWWPAAGLEEFDADLAPWPDWLCVPERKSARGRQGGVRATAIRALGDEAIGCILRKASQANEGERNSMAFWAGCRLGEQVGLGLLGAEEAYRLVAEAAETAGLGSEEAWRVARSGVDRTA